MPEDKASENLPEQVQLVRTLQGMTEAEVDAALAAAKLAKALAALQPRPQQREVLAPVLDRYLGGILDRVEGLGLRIRYK